MSEVFNKTDEGGYQTKTEEIAADAASDCCGSCCGDASEEAEQKAAINAAHPLTGDPEVDKDIQAIRDQEFKEWQKAKDIKKFDDLPKAMKDQLPVLKEMADQLASSIPAADMDLTLTEATRKYPDKVAAIYKKLQDTGMAPKGMPLELALAMANNTEVGQIKLSEIKGRIDNVAAAKGMGGGASIAAVGGGLAIGAVVLGGLFWFLKGRK